jgi:hypothetical protein
MYPTADTTSVDVIFGIKLGDEAAFDNIFNSMKVEMGLKDEAGGYVMSVPAGPSAMPDYAEMERTGEYKMPEMKMRDIHLFKSNGVFFVTTRGEFAEKIKAGGFAAGDRLSGDVLKEVTSHVMGAYGDGSGMSAFINAASGPAMMYSSMDPTSAYSQKAIKEMFVTMFDHFTMAADRSNSVATVFLKDKSKNSLRLIIDYMAKMGMDLKKMDDAKKATNLNSLMDEEQANKTK